jgi:hypothetical protein
MTKMIRSIVFASAALCATAAFAADKAVVNVPFSFQAHGHNFAAGEYSVILDQNQSVMTLRNTEDARQSVQWKVSPGVYDADSQVLRLKFDDAGSAHLLRTVQFGPRITSVLDAAALHDAGSVVNAVGGQ